VLAFVARILVAAHVKPRPTVEAPILHPRHEIRHEIVAEFVPLVYRSPQIACGGMNGEPDRIAETGRKDPTIFAIRIIFEYARAIFFRVAVINV
jgi:hypothetical protein